MPISLFIEDIMENYIILTQNSTLLLLPVSDNSASVASYLSSCDAQCLSSVFLIEFTEGAVMTENGRLFQGVEPNQHTLRRC